MLFLIEECTGELWSSDVGGVGDDGVVGEEDRGVGGG